MIDNQVPVTESNLTQILIDQVNSNRFQHIDLSLHHEWLNALNSKELLDLFTAWGEYRGCIIAAGGRAQVHEIEGWIIDNLFLTPEEDWWVWRNFYVDTSEYLDEPFMYTPISVFLEKVDAIQRHLIGAVYDYGSNLRQGILSIDNTNSRLLDLYKVSATEWLDWYNGAGEGIASLEMSRDLEVLYNMLTHTVADLDGLSADDESYSLEA